MKRHIVSSIWPERSLREIELDGIMAEQMNSVIEGARSNYQAADIRNSPHVNQNMPHGTHWISYCNPQTFNLNLIHSLNSFFSLLDKGLDIRMCLLYCNKHNDTDKKNTNT